MTKQDLSENSSINRIKDVLKNRHKIYFRELVKEANVSTQELEDYLLPLLGWTIEGKLEVRCPDCGADLGSFSNYYDIPKENDCEICGHSIPFSDNYLEIVLEVKGDFFRVADQEPQPFIKKNYTNEQLKTLLENAIKEKKEVPKGKMFEEFFRSLVEREAEFVLKKPRARSNVGEMDYFYRADCRGHPLWDKYPYFFVECKNRKEVVSAQNMNNFKELLEQKVVFHNCFGIYITTKSFSKPANTSAQKGIDKGLVIIRINRSEMTALIEKGFKRFIEEAFDEFLSKA